MFKLLNRDRRYVRNLRRTFSVLAASGLSLFTLSCAPSNPIRAQDKPAAVPVRTAVVRLTTVTDTFQVPGTVKARTHSSFIESGWANHLSAGSRGRSNSSGRDGRGGRGA